MRKSILDKLLHGLNVVLTFFIVLLVIAALDYLLIAFIEWQADPFFMV